jgi:hypothetical protein
MTLLTVKLSSEDVALLATLASDQLFRREFIDPKMPGYRSNPEELGRGKRLVERLRTLVDGGASKKLPRRNGATV